MRRFFDEKSAIWINTRSSIDNTLHGSSRAVGKSGTLLQIKKAPEASSDLMCCMFRLEDAVAHLSVTNPSAILLIEK